MADKPDKPDTSATISDDATAAKQIIFGEQAALMLNVDLILDKLVNINNDRALVKYRNFSTIRGTVNTNNATDIYGITSLITKNPAMQRFFYKIPPSVLSILQPSIKLYKTFYAAPAKQSGETSNSNSLQGYDWRIPFDDVSVGSSGSIHSTEYVNETLDNILRGSGRLNGVGVKSFSYSYKGTNPAEINTNIVANLELHVQSPDDLLRTINVRSDDARFAQSASGIYGLPQDLTFGYSDLVNQSSRFKSNSTTESKELEPNLHYYRIKAVVGYAMPPEHYFENLGITGDDLKELKTAIGTAKVILLLTPYSHSIDFSENGNIVLKIEYHASIDRLLTSKEADVFKISNKYQDYMSAKKEYQVLIDSKEKEIKKLKCKDGKISRELTKEQKENLDSEYETNLKELQKKYQTATKDLYSTIIQSILSINVESSYTGIFKVQLDPSAIGVTRNDYGGFGSFFNAGGEALEAADFVRIENLKDSRKVNNILLLNAEQRKKEKEQLEKDLGVKSKIFGTTPESSKEVAENANKRQTDSKEEAEVDGDGFVNVKFVFLGDVLDAALECIRYLRPLNDIPKIILGNIDLEIPTDYIGSGGSTEALTKKVTINLADIPIAFENLYSFLIDKIIRQGRSTYPVLNFIKDVISQLVITSVSPKYFGQSAKINSTLRISTIHLAAPMNGKVDPILNIPSSIYSSFSKDENLKMPIKNISDINKQQLLSQMAIDFESPLAKDVSSYLFIYCSSQFNNKKVGDEDKDIDEGIFHFRIGTDSGIVKKITFSKTDSPFYREAVAAQEGKDNVSLIKQVYDAKIEMFGNNIYRPGDVIYIEPYASFIDHKRTFYLKDNKQEVRTIDLQDAVGIGGYYLVIDVETNINENVFNTTLNTVFKAHKYRGAIDDPDNNNCG